MPRLPRFLRWLLLGAVTVVMIGGLVAGILVMRISSGLPDVQTLRTIELQEPLYVYARDGRLMGLFGEMRRYPVDIKDVPLQVKQAFLAAEDARFYQHHGVDFKGVARAIWLLATTSDKRVPGGSTITQQVARQFFLSNEYSYSRKFAEMLLAMKMERELSKDEILGLYLNTSFFGNRAYGVAAAAEFYYGKTLAQLSLDEAATLAGIPKFPSSGNPLDNPERARIRRDNYILPRMAALGFVSRVQADAASAVPMHASPHERQIEVYAPYVAEMARQEMVERFGEDVLTKGYHVTTTIDPTLQAAADSAVVEGMRVYDHRHGWRKPSRQVQIPAGADDAMIARLLRGIPTQGGLVPAVVTGTEGAGLVVVLPDASRQVLTGKAIAWAGQSAGTLATRGDVVRVRRTDSDPAQAGWVLDQVPLAQAALVSLDADTGALRALVGGYSYASSKFNRATQAKRQPGSSFKPFLYAASFERGFNPASIVLDAPVVFRDRSNHVWRPKNDSGNFAGPIRLREALVQSRNLVSVRLLDAIGVDYARRYISHFGFDEASLPPNLSMSLGSASLTPLSVARGFAAFANGGFLVAPWFIDSVRDAAGHEVFREKPATACPECAVTTSAGQQVPAAAATKVDGFDFGPARTAAAEPTTRPAAGSKNGKPDVTAKPVDPAMVVAPRAIDPRVAWQLQSMMRDVVKRGTATAARVLNRGDVGGKTGSTNDHRDAWFSGFGGPYATTVWVGRDDFKSLGYREYGGRAALPIWIDYMRVALKDQPERLPEPPAGMVEVRSNGVVEWLKVEDEERVRNELDVAPEDNAQPTEEAFDIF